ncbi:DNA-binding transcriptional regulator, GntR family [Devosia enhydra]|uniref:DNA-binding transcriptional regulator, GntR family n=1 Tax=Devosia enhydra TaxID=665118 RepID=A0A1K2I141_9HYPH|nr:GntR family transcriptional regulator [Devosia enhydra]SFZ85931.1 DNA-binding transcriptional regulator, GntR family [Devosia enhydra]
MARVGDKAANDGQSWQPIHAAITGAILTHDLLPGTKLPEDELAALFSVSRTVVRAALQALAHDRIVQLEKNRGAFVAQPSKKEAKEVFEARALIEPKVAAMAANNARPSDIVRLKRCLAEEEEAVHQQKRGEALLLSARFHESIAEIANHTVYFDIVRNLCAKSSLIIALYSARVDIFCERHAHDALVEAIANKSAHDAEELMLSHIVDLFSGIDARERPASTRDLAEILGRHVVRVASA